MQNRLDYHLYVVTEIVIDEKSDSGKSCEKKASCTNLAYLPLMLQETF